MNRGWLQRAFARAGPRPENTRRGAVLHVSFDLDDTLVCAPHVPTEQHVAVWARRRYPEPIRRGTRALMRQLAAKGCRVWIYTSSRRSARYIRGWFRSMGIRLEGVVTLCHHETVVGWRGPSKFPPAFGIGLHVDDSPGVALEGQEHGFKVVVVRVDDPHWTRRVEYAVDELLGAAAQQHAAARQLGHTTAAAAQAS